MKALDGVGGGGENKFLKDFKLFYLGIELKYHLKSNQF
jgi:hypothetical protein